MKKIIVLAIAASLSAPLFADELVEGQWDGKVMMHDKKPANAVFRVRAKHDGDSEYKIEMFYIERPYKFRNLEVDASRMRFSIDTGEKYDCILSLDEADKDEIEECREKPGYCGQCLHQADDETRRIVINMQPPAAEPDAGEAQTGEKDKPGKKDSGNGKAVKKEDKKKKSD